MRILSADGGGSKLNILLFDEELRRIGAGRSGGIRPPQISEKVCRQHVESCLDQVFKSGVPCRLDVVYGTDRTGLLGSALEARVRAERYEPLSEPLIGLLAGSFRQEGFLALSGTGSDVFYVHDGICDYIGGEGAILGDDGSGAWIGHQAVRAAVRCMNGWGEKSALYDMIFEYLQISSRDELIMKVYTDPAPYSLLASLSRVAGKAAREGDAVALDIVERAGELMALQMLALMERQRALPRDKTVTLCGGAWKTHPGMIQAFERSMKERVPDIRVALPFAEAVCAGPVRVLLDRGCARSDIESRLCENFGEYVIDWEKVRKGET